MAKKARTPIVEYEDSFAIELPGEGTAQEERDHLNDQAMIVIYEHRPGRPQRWRLRGLSFDRNEWTRSGIRRWWAAHEVQFLGQDQLDKPIPEICRSYPAPGPGLPTILLCHRNTPLVPAKKQVARMATKAKSQHHGR